LIRFSQALFVAVIRIGAMGRFLSHALAMIGVVMLLGPLKSCRVVHVEMAAVPTT